MGTGRAQDDDRPIGARSTGNGTPCRIACKPSQEYKILKQNYAHPQMREGAEGSCGSHKEGARWVVWRPLDRSLMVSKKTIVLIETYSADGWGISDRFSPDNEKKFSYPAVDREHKKLETNYRSDRTHFPRKCLLLQVADRFLGKLVILWKIRGPVKRDNQFLEQTKPVNRQP